jgi:hypothetical protein
VGTSSANLKQIDVEFILYISENLSTLDYRLQEEVMTVVQQLSQVVSSCSHLVAVLESASFAGEEVEILKDKCVRIGEVSIFCVSWGHQLIRIGEHSRRNTDQRYNPDRLGTFDQESHS